MPGASLSVDSQTRNKLVTLQNETSQLLLGDAAHLHHCFALHGGIPLWHVIKILETSRVHAKELQDAAQGGSRYDR